MSKSNKPYANAALALANLTALRGGAVLEDLADAIMEATESTKITKRPSRVTLTLDIEPADKKAQDVDRVWVGDSVTVKLPPAPKKDTLLFVDPVRGTLCDKDPQLSLVVGARPVEREPAQAPRELAKDAAGEARSLAG